MCRGQSLEFAGVEGGNVKSESMHGSTVRKLMVKNEYVKSGNSQGSKMGIPWTQWRYIQRSKTIHIMIKGDIYWGLMSKYQVQS